jgi:uncharacterized phage infection (PIP) family protein YhgE
MSSIAFEAFVREKLSSIDERLENIEARFDEATNFASNMIGEDGGLLGALDFSLIRDVMSSLTNSAEAGSEAGDDEQGQLADLTSALQSFREKLTDLKSILPPDLSSLTSEETSE